MGGNKFYAKFAEYQHKSISIYTNTHMFKHWKKSLIRNLLLTFVSDWLFFLLLLSVCFVPLSNELIVSHISTFHVGVVHSTLFNTPQDEREYKRRRKSSFFLCSNGKAIAKMRTIVFAWRWENDSSKVDWKITHTHSLTHLHAIHSAETRSIWQECERKYS